ncbi:MAG: PTS sugar transporter subunit IIB [Propionicimonas sp.]
MAIENLVLTRIDDRLIHGQVMTAWLKVAPASQIIAVDDAVAADEFLSEIMAAAAPSGIKVKVVSVDQAVPILQQPLAEKTYLLVKTPITLTRLVAAGIPLTQVNVGGMGMNPSRKRLYKNIAASDEEVAAFRQLADAGATVSFQIVPAERSYDLSVVVKGGK